MDTADGTDAFVLGKRKHRDPRQRQRKQIRKMSMQLVRSGQIPKKPCLPCGSQQSLTIRHFEPIRPEATILRREVCSG